MKVNLIDAFSIEESKIWGEAFLPDEWLQQDVFSPNEFFLAQINLSKLNVNNLPHAGYLYIFIDAPSFALKRMKPVIRYSATQPDAYTDFNDCFFDEAPESFVFEKSQGEGDIVLSETEGNYTTLINLPRKYLPVELDFNEFAVKISSDDLKNMNFANAFIVVY